MGLDEEWGTRVALRERSDPEAEGETPAQLTGVLRPGCVRLVQEGIHSRRFAPIGTGGVTIALTLSRRKARTIPLNRVALLLSHEPRATTAAHTYGAKWLK